MIYDTVCKREVDTMREDGEKLRGGIKCGESVNYLKH